MTTDRDPQVAAALDLIDAVPPRPGFWDELEARLQGEPPAPVLELAQIPGYRPTRRRRAPFLVAAAAAIVALAVVGLVVRAGDGHDTVPAHPAPTPSTTTVDPTTPQAQALATADRWIATLTAHDAVGGWALVGPSSRDSLGSEAAYADLVAGTGAAAGNGDLASTWASFGPGPTRAATAAELGDSEIWLVALQRTGEPAPVALLVRLADAHQVEPFLPGTALDLIGVPGFPAGSGLATGAPVPISVEADATGVAAVLDGVAVAPSQLVRDAGGRYVGVRATKELAPGTHTLAVAASLPGGGLEQAATAFAVG